jgi:hypothetical protein
MTHYLPRAAIARWAALCTFALLGSGCQYLGLLAYAAPDPTVGPKYKGLADQKAAVMVWADNATAIDWPHLQLDVARGTETRLRDASKKPDKYKELKGTVFAAPESVVRYQHDHPESAVQSVTEFAPRLDITRLIYVEIQQFSTRPEESQELYRGELVGNVKLVEVVNGRAKVVFTEENIKVVYPEKSPEEGVPAGSDMQMYEKTVDAFSEQVANRFMTHVEPRFKDE